MSDATELERSVEAAKDAGIQPVRLQRLLERVRREIDSGLLPAVQIAIARDGAVAFAASFGAAGPRSLFSVFSATKAITSAAGWLLLQDDVLDESERVTAIVPEFGENGKADVRVEQLFLHTAGFPNAPFRPLDWLDAERREARWRQWRLEWPPGSRYEYHPTSSMWVIAEMIERRGGMPFTEFVRTRVIEPLGLRDLYVGLPAEENARVVPCTPVGDALTAADYEALGVPQPPVTEVTEEAILNFNRPEVRAVGVPGGGAITTAADLALFWQGVLHGGRNAQRVWTDATLERARRVRTAGLTDPLYRKPVSRGLGIIIAGDESRHYRGFGHTNSPGAIGHNGAGGQLAWADPTSGLSFAYVTGGHDRNPVREARRGVAISSLAAVLADPL
jgi:CubicO group peptidase (beta-lactamase class C family)